MAPFFAQIFRNFIQQIDLFEVQAVHSKLFRLLLPF